jgi:hypothetical protein
MRTARFAPLLALTLVACDASGPRPDEIDEVDALDPLADPLDADGEPDDRPPPEPLGQSFGAPAAAHAWRSATAWASSVGPFGGMSPPRYVRHEALELAMPGIWPRPLSHEYAAEAVRMPPWQSGHCPDVPDAR